MCQISRIYVRHGAKFALHIFAGMSGRSESPRLRASQGKILLTNSSTALPLCTSAYNKSMKLILIKSVGQLYIAQPRSPEGLYKLREHFDTNHSNSSLFKGGPGSLQVKRYYNFSQVCYIVYMWIIDAAGAAEYVESSSDFCRGSDVESQGLKVKGQKSRVEGKKSRVTNKKSRVFQKVHFQR